MKRILTFTLLLAVLLSFSACVGEKEDSFPEMKIAFPFDVKNIEKIDVTYTHFEDGKASEKKAELTDENDLKEIYNVFTDTIKLTNKKTKAEENCDTVSFIFRLDNKTTYDLTYSAIAVKSGRLKSEAGLFDCFTSADVIGISENFIK